MTDRLKSKKGERAHGQLAAGTFWGYTLHPADG